VFLLKNNNGEISQWEKRYVSKLVGYAFAQLPK